MDIIALEKDKTQTYLQQLAENKFGTAVKAIKYIGGGSYGLVYRAEIESAPRILVLKAYRVKDMHLTEKMQIELLSQHSGIPFPKIYFAHSADDTIPVDALAMEYIDGVNAFNPLFMLKSKAKRMQFGELIAKNSIQLHTVTNAKFGYLDNPVYETWNAFYYRFAADVLERTKEFVHTGQFAKKHLMTMQKAFDNFDKVFCEKVEKPSLLHADLNVANILVNKKTLEPIAIIDPYNSMWGDREYDLFQFHNFFNGTYRIYEAYKARTKVSEHCDLKIAFYSFFNEINCYMTSGVKIELFNIRFNKALLKEMKRFGIR